MEKRKVYQVTTLFRGGDGKLIMVPYDSRDFATIEEAFEYAKTQADYHIGWGVYREYRECMEACFKFFNGRVMEWIVTPHSPF